MGIFNGKDLLEMSDEDMDLAYRQAKQRNRDALLAAGGLFIIWGLTIVSAL